MNNRSTAATNKESEPVDGRSTPEVEIMAQALMKESNGNTIRAKHIFLGLQDKLIQIIEQDLNRATHVLNEIQEYVAERKSALESLKKLK